MQNDFKDTFNMDTNKIYASMLADASDFLKLESLLSPALPNAPFGKAMRQTLDWFINKAKGYGLNAYEKDGYYGVVEIGSGTDMFAYACHLDVVGVGTGWTVPAFDLTQKDGFLLGRGIVDNKGPAIAMLHVLKAIKDNGINLKHRVRLIVGCNEESGSLCLKKYAEVDEVPKFTLVPDADFPTIHSEKGILQVEFSVPVCDTFKSKISTLTFGGANTNVIPEVASAVVNGSNIVVNGVAGHAMAPHKADNAAWKLFKELANLCPCCKNVYSAICNHNASKTLGIDFKDETSGELTMALTKGSFYGSNLKLHFDIRLPICADKDKVIKKIAGGLNQNQKEYNNGGVGHNTKNSPPLEGCPQGGVGYKITAYKQNLYIDPNSPLVTTLVDIYKKQTGDTNAQSKKIGGGTYARELPNAIAFGATFGGYDTAIHNADEKVSLLHFNKWFDIYYAATLEMDKVM